MIKEEWKNLFHNKILLAVVLVIALIPAIYAGLFLASMWDPYGNVDKLPVAVVNEDQPVKYQDATLSVGDELVKKLREDGSMDFHFVGQRTAEEGLQNGTYYMVITIPENFSADAATVMEEHPRQMCLDYETNPGTNYIASKLSETALEKIRSGITEEVTRTYTEVIFDQIQDAGDGMEQAADGARQLQDGAKEASRGSSTITENLRKLADSTLTFRDGSKELTQGLEVYTEGVAQVHEGAGQLDEGVRTLTGKLPELLDGAKELREGTEAYTAGVSQLNQHSEELTAGSGRIVEGTQALQEGADSLARGVQEYVAGVGQLTDGLLGTEQTMGYLEGADALTVGLLGDGTKENPGYLAGVERLAQGASSLEVLKNLGKVSGAVTKMSKSVSGDGEATLEKGTQSLMAGLKTIRDQAASLENTVRADGLKEMNKSLQDVGEGIDRAAEGMEEASKEMETSAEQLADASKVCGVVSENLQSLTGIEESQQQCEDVTAAMAAQGNEKLGQANEQIQSGQNAMETAVQQIRQICAEGQEETVTVSRDTLEQLADSLEGAETGMTGVEEINTEDSLSQVQEIFGQLAQQLQTAEQSSAQANEKLSELAGDLGDKAQSLVNRASKMKGARQQMEKGAAGIPAKVPEESLKELTQGLDRAYQASCEVSQGTKQLGEGLKELEQGTQSFPQAAEGIQELIQGFDLLTQNDAVLLEGARSLQNAGETVRTGASQLRDNGEVLLSGTSQAAEGIQALATGAGQLNAGVKSYTSGIQKLDQNSGKLNDGAQALASGADTLSTGAQQLADGTSSLYAGTRELDGNSSSLLEGASRLTDGSEQIHTGEKQLAEGSGQLGTGLKKLEDGSGTLAASLSDGASQVKEKKAKSQNIKMISDPVTDKETKITKVPNNGHAMAPYMMSVGLWVGSLAFCLMYPLTTYKGKLKSGTAWWASKASVLGVLALLQGALVILLLHIFDGFIPVQMGKAIAFSCLASVAFTSITYFFNVFLGKVGSFLMLIFMVVQLAGSAGTYPVEVSPSFVAKIHSLVPFTYTVDAFRSVICGGESIQEPVLVMAGITIVFTILTLLLFRYRAEKIRKGETMIYDFLEEKGLA